MSSSNKKIPAAMVGIDIGIDSIKVAEAKYSDKDGITITGLGIARTPFGVIDNEMIIDPKGLGEAIKVLLNDSGIKTRKCVSSIAGQSKVVVRVIEVPKMEPKELAESMKWEVERQVPFSPSDIEMDFQALEIPNADPNAQTMEVFMAVAQRDLVQQHVEALEAAGLSPVAIDVEPLAAGRAIVGDGSLNDDIVAVISIGSQNTEIGIFDKGTLVFPSPPIGIAGNSFTREISEALGIGMEDAEVMKKEYAVVDLKKLAAQAAADTTSYDTSFGPQIPHSTPFDGDQIIHHESETALGTESSALNNFQSASPEDLGIGGPSFDLQDDFAGGPSFDMGEEKNASAEEKTVPEEGPAFDLGEDLPAIAAEPASLDDLNVQASDAAVPAGEEVITPNFDIADVDENADLGEAVVVQSTGAARNDEAVENVFNAISSVLIDLANEIRRTIEYYNVRYSKLPNRIVLCGGTAKIPNLDKFLSKELGIPVEVADPGSKITLNVPSLSDHYLKEMSAVFPVSVGLAIRDMVG